MTVIKLKPELIDAHEASKSIPFSDDDLALKFASKHDNEIRHVDDWGKWFLWDGSAWKRDDKLRVFDMARDVCREEFSNPVGEGAGEILDQRTHHCSRR